MRRAAVLKVLAAATIPAFAFAAYGGGDVFAGGRQQAVPGFIWLALAALASGYAAKLLAPMSLLGHFWRWGAPLSGLLAAPYIMRLLFLNKARRASAAAPKPPPASPYALPARMAVALAAAARARK